ncbi:TetR/AcrR family transcriptional regulator [Mariniluteicoccus endophyticus]
MITQQPLGRRERAKAEKRAKILAAARRLIAEKGYAAMTMADVAKAADVAAGTVFQYAATKPELLMMVSADYWRQSAANARTREPSGDTEQDIRALVRPVVDVSLERREVATWVARELIFGAPGPHRAEVLSILDELEGKIARVIAADGVPSARADAAARLIVSGTLVELNRVREGRKDPAAAVAGLDELVGIVVRGAAAP